MEYNYPRFKPAYYDLSDFSGPKAGEKFIDFDAYGLNGKKVKLSDFLDKPLVLETGSITCPMFVKCIKPMNKLMERYKEVNFIVLYVREAHPGTKTPEHSDLIEKINNAKRNGPLYNDKREIIVDSVNGNAHLKYGAMPNMIYIFDFDGTVLFRGDWNNLKMVEKVLKNIGSRPVITDEHFEPTKPTPNILFPTLLVGGWNALWDFIKGLPGLLVLHYKANKKYGK
jgi:hypothetical protein